jgi:hypothetical protein
MPKSVQVRVPKDLAADLGIVASAMGKSIPEYVEDNLRAAVARDMPHAARVAKERADALKKRRPAAEPSAEDN